MCTSNVRCLALCAALVVGFAQAASATDILIGDAKSQPESLTVAPGGVLIVGSASSPFVYKMRPGASTAEKFIDATAEGPGTFFFGMLADASSNTLWTCQLTPIPDTKPVHRHTALRIARLGYRAQVRPRQSQCPVSAPFQRWPVRPLLCRQRSQVRSSANP